jgi:antitoxin component of RelBE/YafQ-DinJ toxin-antitoxin module
MDSRLTILVDETTKTKITSFCDRLDLTLSQVIRAMVRDLMDGAITIEVIVRPATELSNLTERVQVLISPKVVDQLKGWCKRRFTTPSLVMRALIEAALAGKVSVKGVTTAGAALVVRETRP